MPEGSDRSGAVAGWSRAPGLCLLVVAVPLAVAGTACGSQHAAQPATAPPGVAVGDAAHGTTLRLTTGQHVRVHLSDGSYDSPVSSHPGTVVRRRITGGYPGSDPVDADFQAVASGSAEIQTTTDAACLHSQPRCLIPQRLWTLHVVVR